MSVEVTSEKKQGSNKTGSASGEAGSSNLLKGLISVGATGEVSGEQNKEQLIVRKESRSYTEAALAIDLYHQLKADSELLFTPKSVKDLEGCEPGTLLEISGKIEKNAIDSVIDCLDAVTILLDGIKPQGNEKSSSSKSQQGVQGFSAQELKKQNSQLKALRDALEKDRKRTPISNVIVYCSEPKNLNAVVNLRTDNIRDLTLSELHKNNVRIIGKVTRVIKENDSIHTFENYGMSLINEETLSTTFQQITHNPAISVGLPDIEISGPAIQILPLMIFV